MKKYYPGNMKIPGAHLQMMSNQFSEISCTYFPVMRDKISCPQTGDRQTDRRTDRQTDGRTHRQTLGHTDR